MGGGADDDFASPFFYSCSNSLPTVTTPENSKVTVSPDKNSSKLIEKITVFADHFTVEFKSGIIIDIEA